MSFLKKWSPVLGVVAFIIVAFFLVGHVWFMWFCGILGIAGGVTGLVYIVKFIIALIKKPKTVI
jgi:hypothetical protein